MRILTIIISAAVCLVTGCVDSGSSGFTENDFSVEALLERDRWVVDSLFADFPLDLAQPSVCSQEVDSVTIEALVDRLPLKEKVGQLFVVPLRPGRNGQPSDEAIAMVEDLKVGGFLVPRLMHPVDIALESAILQHRSAIPLFIAADYERGVGRFNNAFTELPSNMGIGATRSAALAAAAGRLTGIESRSIGVNLLFAPVVDVNSNPENPIINIRSYSDDPSLVTRTAMSFIVEVEKYGVTATVKHYPGHGGTDVDSHAGLPIVESASLAEGLEPFGATLSDSLAPGAVMSGHVSVPSMDATGVPATMSRSVIDHLRDEFQYTGLVVTDDLRMGAVARQYSLKQRVLTALLAGNDILLTPESITTAINVVVEAVEAGDVDEALVTRSVVRIITAKRKSCIEGRSFRKHANLIEEFVPGKAVAEYIASRAVTANFNQDGPFPISQIEHFANYSGSQTIAHAQKQFDAIVDEGSGAGTTLIVLYARLVEGSGSAGFSEQRLAEIRTILDGNRHHLIVILGNPYLAAQFPGSNMLIGYDQSASTVKAVIDVIGGRGQAAGKLPVDISR